MEDTIKLSRDGQLKLSSELRRALGISDGEALHVKVVGHSLILTPEKVIAQDQQYFWSADWQAAEREAQSDIDAGRVETFENVGDLISDLNS